MLPLRDIIRMHGISFHSYASVYLAVSPDEMSSVKRPNDCLLEIKLWVAKSFLQLKQGKTEIWSTVPEDQREINLKK